MLDQIEVKDEASEFKIEELFFSRTDKRGMIQAGNEVFYRVSGYESSELQGAPHKTIRHPDMPKALFWIMWDMIKRDELIGAYVKNRTKDGGYYWVFAITTPIDGGYLSIRQKPTSKMLQKIDQLYVEVRNRELTQEVSAEDSAKYLLERLRDMGYDSYTDFMTEAMIEECSKRCQSLGLPIEDTMAEIAKLKENAESTLEIAQNVLDDFSTIAGFPVNMHIQASKLKANGRIFGSIADNYQRLSKRVETSMRDFITARKSASNTVDGGLFRLMLALTQGEMVKVFQAEHSDAQMYGDEPANSALDINAEIGLLDQQRQHNHHKSVEGLNAISSEYKNFTRLIDEMSGILSALSVTQFVGLVETARLDTNGETLKAMLQDVTGVQTQAQENLKKLESLNREIATKVTQLAKRLATSG